MQTSNLAPRGMVVTPHHLATQSALNILRAGGSAMEAMVAAAATVAVVYPHTNSIGGDGFWLIVPPQGDPIAIDASGAAGCLATEEYFTGFDTIPKSGPKSAITVAGAVGGWEEALNFSSQCGYPRFSNSQLLSDAILYAEEGYPISASQEECLISFLNGNPSLSEEFKTTYLVNGKIPKVGKNFRQKKLANTLKILAKDGFSSFYQGKLAKVIAKDALALGIPITEIDLKNYLPVKRIPLKLQHKYGEILNIPPPTQGLVSLSILGILDELNITGQDEGKFIHATVEATKQAFEVRDKFITDPRYMTVDAQSRLTQDIISAMAGQINFDLVSAAVKGEGQGDTVWMGVMDNKGFSVSYIQSVYHVFGSGMVLPQSGILWHNRGVSFNLQKDHIRYVIPGKKPFHTLNPAAAILNDGRVMVYGTQGGDGQPQTQAAIFHRYVVQGINLQRSISLPRWLYGTPTGVSDNTLRLEDSFKEETKKYLEERGHNIIKVPLYDRMMGEAGAIVRHPNGVLEGAFDPRSNGSAAGY